MHWPLIGQMKDFGWSSSCSSSLRRPKRPVPELESAVRIFVSTIKPFPPCPEAPCRMVCLGDKRRIDSSSSLSFPSVRIGLQVSTVQPQSAVALVHAPARAVKVKSAEPDVNDCCGVTLNFAAPSQPVIAADTVSPDGTVAGAGVVAVTVHVNVPNCAAGS